MNSNLLCCLYQKPAENEDNKDKESTDDVKPVEEIPELDSPSQLLTEEVDQDPGHGYITFRLPHVDNPTDATVSLSLNGKSFSLLEAAIVYAGKGEVTDI